MSEQIILSANEPALPPNAQGAPQESSEMQNVGSIEMDHVALKKFWEEKAAENSRYYICTFGKEAFDVPEEMFNQAAKTDVNSFVAYLRDEKIVEKTIVDVGCGIGRCSKEFAKIFKRVVAVDFSETMIAQARDYLSEFENVTTLVNDGRTLAALADGSTDFVFSLFVFQHIFDDEVRKSYIREFARVLRPGGMAYIQAKVYGGKGDAMEGRWDGPGFPLPALTAVAEECGLFVSDIRSPSGTTLVQRLDPNDSRFYFRNIYLGKPIEVV